MAGHRRCEGAVKKPSEDFNPPAELWRRGGIFTPYESAYFSAFWGVTSTLIRWGFAASTFGSVIVSRPFS